MFTIEEREILVEKLEGFTGTLDNPYTFTDKTLARLLCTILHYSKLDPVKRFGKSLTEKLFLVGRV